MSMPPEPPDEIDEMLADGEQKLKEAGHSVNQRSPTGSPTGSPGDKKSGRRREMFFDPSSIKGGKRRTRKQKRSGKKSKTSKKRSGKKSKTSKKRGSRKRA